MGKYIVFGGKRWKVNEVESDKKAIYVERAQGGKPPKFGENGLSIYDVVRQEMFKILLKGDYRISIGDKKVDFADSTAQELFRESAEFFNKAGLAGNAFLQVGSATYLFT